MVVIAIVPPLYIALYWLPYKREGLATRFNQISDTVKLVPFAAPALTVRISLLFYRDCLYLDDFI